MAIARDTTAANIEPKEGAIVRRYTAGATIAAGEIVSMQSDGYVDPSDSTSAAQMIVGIALAAAVAATRWPGGSVAATALGVSAVVLLVGVWTLGRRRGTGTGAALASDRDGPLLLPPAY